MKLGKKVYLNKLNGKHYREIFESRTGIGITLTKNNIRLLNEGVRFFRAVDDVKDLRISSHSEIAQQLEEVTVGRMEAKNV